MRTYDMGVVLGSQPDPKNWQFPSHVYQSLDKSAELLKQEIFPYIALSGKWTISFDTLKITQPFRECDAMAEYLLLKGVPPEALILEGDSQDTPSNLYYLKRQVFVPKHAKRLVFFVAKFRAERIAYLCMKILGPGYKVDTVTVQNSLEENYQNEPHTFALQKAFLDPMKDGDDAWLDDKFFSMHQFINHKLKSV